MNTLINVTQARNNLSLIISQVFKKKKRFILIRDSVPQAVIIPYEEMIEEENNWQSEVDQLMDQGRGKFKKWLKANKIPSKKLSEGDVYAIIDKTTGRR